MPACGVWKRQIGQRPAENTEDPEESPAAGSAHCMEFADVLLGEGW